MHGHPVLNLFGGLTSGAGRALAALLGLARTTAAALLRLARGTLGAGSAISARRPALASTLRHVLARHAHLARRELVGHARHLGFGTSGNARALRPAAGAMAARAARTHIARSPRGLTLALSARSRALGTLGSHMTATTTLRSLAHLFLRGLGP